MASLCFAGNWRAVEPARAAPSGQQADGAAASVGTVGLSQLSIHPQAGHEPMGAAHRGPAGPGYQPRHRVHPVRDLQVHLQPAHPGQRPAAGKGGPRQETGRKPVQEKLKDVPQLGKVTLFKISPSYITILLLLLLVTNPLVHQDVIRLRRHPLFVNENSYTNGATTSLSSKPHEILLPCTIVPYYDICITVDSKAMLIV